MSISTSALAIGVDDIVDALVATVPQPPEDKTSVIVEGEMGIGKSSILKELGRKLPEHIPIYFDCTTKADAGDVMMPKFKDLDGQDYVSFATNEELGMHLTDIYGLTKEEVEVIDERIRRWELENYTLNATQRGFMRMHEAYHIKAQKFHKFWRFEIFVDLISECLCNNIIVWWIFVARWRLTHVCLWE